MILHLQVESCKFPYLLDSDQSLSPHSSWSFNKYFIDSWTNENSSVDDYEGKNHSITYFFLDFIKIVTFTQIIQIEILSFACSFRFLIAIFHEWNLVAPNGTILPLVSSLKNQSSKTLRWLPKRSTQNPHMHLHPLSKKLLDPNSLFKVK